MKLKFTLCIGFILSLLFLFYVIFHVYSLYFSKKESCIKELDKPFRIAQAKEAKKRFEDNNIPFFTVNIPDEPTPETARLISATDTMKVNRTKEYLALSTEEKIAFFDQTILYWEEFFIQLEDVKNIWSEKLAEKRIYMEVGVKYRHRDLAETLYSEADSLFYATASRLDEYRTGALGNEITLQGFYKLTPKTVFYYAKKEFIILGIIGGFFLISLIVTYLLIIKYTQLSIKSLIEIPEEGEYLQVRKSKCYAINDYITFDVERNLLVSEDNREARLTPKMVDLLEQLILSPYFYASNTDLWKNIWDIESDTSNVLTQLIRNFREELAIFPELEVRSIHRKGYQLIIYPFDDPHIDPPLPPAPEGDTNVEGEDEITTPPHNDLQIENI